MEKIAIVTVDFNGHKDTLELLRSGESLNTRGFDVKWFLVDNGSDSNLSDSLPHLILDYEILQTGENRGFSGGYNFGIKYALNWGASYVFVINNDTLIGDLNILQKLTKVLAREKNIAAVSPKILFAPGYEFYKDRYEKKDLGRVIWYAGGYFDWKNVFGKNRGIDEIDRGQYDKLESVDFISGCAFLIKKEAFNKVGYFDEGLFAYFEDADFMLRAKLAGFKTYYEGRTFIYHKVSRTAGIGSETSDYLLTRNRLYFGTKYASLKTKYALIKEAMRLLIYGRSAQKKGVIDFFKNKEGPPPGIKKSVEISYPLDLSIVIVNYKTPELTLKLLQSIYDKDSGFSEIKGEIVVLDNGSRDEIGQRVKNRFPDVKYIENKLNLGFAKGYNGAISFTKGRLVLLLNSDIEVKKGALGQLIKTSKEFNDQVIIAGKLFLPDGSIQKSCFKLPTISGGIKEYFFGKRGEYSMFAPNPGKIARVEGAVMAAFLIPRNILNKIGNLSEESFLYFEDIEYCRRLKKEGIPVIYDAKAHFLHHHGATSKVIGEEKSYEFLKKGAIKYHGIVKYIILWLILYLGQKFQKLGKVDSNLSNAIK